MASRPLAGLICLLVSVCAYCDCVNGGEGVGGKAVVDGRNQRAIPQMVDAIRKAQKLIDAISGDEPVKYDDEIDLFGEYGSYASIFLQLRLGYINAAGERLRNPPTFSPLLEFMRLKKLIMPGDKRLIQSYAVSTVEYIPNKIGVGGEASIESRLHHGVSVTYHQYRHSTNRVGNTGNTIVMKFGADSPPEIVYPFTLNGKDINLAIGFTPDQEGNFTLPEKLLTEISSHLDHLEDGIRPAP